MATAQFILPLADTLQPADVQEAIDSAAVPIRLVRGQTYEVMRAADILLVASGTATLEAALIGTPMIIVYKAHPLTYLLARLVMRVSSIGLPNVIAGRAIVPELWQSQASGRNMAARAQALLTHPEHRLAMRQDLAALRSQLGTPGVPERVASGILRYLDAVPSPLLVAGSARPAAQP
jgi:lipid-A-disaccharide synthase